MERFLLIVLLLLNMSCSSSKQGSKVPIVVDQDYSKLLDEIVQKKWGKSYATKVNKTNEFVIVLRKTKVFNNLFSDIDFFVFDYKKETIILEDQLEQGSVNWYSNNTILAVSTHIGKGIINKRKYFFNVKTKTKQVLD